MAVEDRRRAILDAVVPLLIEKGSAVTTAEMAQAANIAEGTIFRVFPDKPSILFEAMKAALDPAPVTEAIREIDPSAPMTTQLEQAAQALYRHFDRMVALGESWRSISNMQQEREQDVGRLVRKSAAAISNALLLLFERHREALRVSPLEAAAAFRGILFATRHPLLAARERLAIDAALNILLAGIAKPDPA
jgi:AcrR family transcriptional regulator